MSFLGNKILAKGMTVDPGKIEVVINWPRLCTVSEIRGFLRLAGYYCRFVQNSHIMTPLKKLLKKRISLEWTNKCEGCFKEIKKQLTIAPILTLFKVEEP